MQTNYYSDKEEILRDLFGTTRVRVVEGQVTVNGHSYPIVDDVIILLEQEKYPPSLERQFKPWGSESPRTFARDIQYTFGEEWRRFSEILPEHVAELESYFDLVDFDELRGRRACDLGCGTGRWSYFFADCFRELVLVDFSEAIFVARRNLAAFDNVLFFMADLRELPFRSDFADFLYCLGVLHHLPTPALEEVRALREHAPLILVYLYYALDNRPVHYRVILRWITGIRMITSRVKHPVAREMWTRILSWGVYVPCVAVGLLAERVIGRGDWVPLYEAYRGKSMRRIKQDVYDRFFTRIEQRVTREEILGLLDTFAEIEVSENAPYWHFLCRR